MRCVCNIAMLTQGMGEKVGERSEMVTGRRKGEILSGIYRWPHPEHNLY